MQIVLTTCSTQEEAEALGSQLVEERLVACATALPGATSLYRWRGELTREAECLLLLKTATERVGELEARLHELHSYECPEFLVLDVARASGRYQEWVRESVTSQPSERKKS